jgi:hypothetical protein
LNPHQPDPAGGQAYVDEKGQGSHQEQVTGLIPTGDLKKSLALLVSALKMMVAETRTKFGVIHLIFI